ncbi:hypothetical protein ACWY4P_13610 [Streptomyces sp. LZ34]
MSLLTPPRHTHPNATSTPRQTRSIHRAAARLTSPARYARHPEILTAAAAPSV